METPKEAFFFPASSRCFPKRLLDGLPSHWAKKGDPGRTFQSLRLCVFLLPGWMCASLPVQTLLSCPWGFLCVTNHRQTVFQTRVGLLVTPPSEASSCECVSEHSQMHLQTRSHFREIQPMKMSQSLSAHPRDDPRASAGSVALWDKAEVLSKAVYSRSLELLLQWWEIVEQAAGAGEMAPWGSSCCSYRGLRFSS